MNDYLLTTEQDTSFHRLPRKTFRCSDCERDLPGDQFAGITYTAGDPFLLGTQCRDCRISEQKHVEPPQRNGAVQDLDRSSISWTAWLGYPLMWLRNLLKSRSSLNSHKLAFRLL